MNKRDALRQARSEIHIQKWYCVIGHEGNAEDYFPDLWQAQKERKELIEARVADLMKDESD